MKSIGWVGALALLVGGLGCDGGGGLSPGGQGGSTAGGACGTVQPCGGDVAGSWKITSSCFLDNSIFGIDATEICPTATIDATTSTVTGSATYDADMTYSMNLVTTPIFTMTIPDSCFAAGRTCAEVGPSVMADQAADVKTITCAPSGTSCVCHVVSDTQTDVETGTYSTAGTTLTSGPSADDQESDPYCVQGDQLHILVDTMTSMGAMGKVTIAADIVLTKQ
jgi:hypothetical protein